jgi:hypothetical protein
MCSEASATFGAPRKGGSSLQPNLYHVIRRGKALEYFSRHYGQVYVNEQRPITVAEALAGITQLIGVVQHRRATRVHCRGDFYWRALL